MEKQIIDNEMMKKLTNIIVENEEILQYHTYNIPQYDIAIQIPCMANYNSDENGTPIDKEDKKLCNKIHKILQKSNVPCYMGENYDSDGDFTSVYWEEYVDAIPNEKYIKDMTVHQIKTYVKNLQKFCESFYSKEINITMSDCMLVITKHNSLLVEEIVEGDTFKYLQDVLLSSRKTLKNN
jgi:hypothetical protein